MLYNTLKTATRLLTTATSKVPEICIVGAGPAGFYAAMHLTKNLECKVDMIEKLPVPFGLIRYGVAPDHPEVKNVINQFSKVAEHPKVNFYGNITLGKDVTLQQLREHYDAVLLTYGAEEDRILGIENENASNVIAARSFVGWYNGLPSCKELKVDLSCETAAVFGQGNVALDVARIMLMPIDELRKTDITEHALSALAESKLKELYLIGRRGPLQVAFTIKELREQIKLKNCRTIWRETDLEGVNDIVSSLPRPRKRLTELMLKSFTENQNLPNDGDIRLFKPVFFRSPQKFLVDNENKLSGVELICNKLVGEKWDEQKCVPTNDKEIINCGLAFRSIGYKSISVDSDLAFKNGVVVSNKGCVENNDQHLGNLYVGGWLGTGPVGVILHTMGNAFQVAKVICEHFNKHNNLPSKGGFHSLQRLIQNTEIVDWEGWKKIDEYEIEHGKKRGKPREKICSIEKMIEVAKS